MSDPLLGLVDAASWRGAAVLAKRKLIETHPVQVKDIMRLWLLRLTALIRLRQFEFAYTELERLDVGNYHNVEWRYETYPDVFPGMSGCMITFEIKSLWATMPGRHGNHGESLNRLYQLVSECKGMARRCRAVNGTADDEAESVWLSRGQALQLQVASYLVELRDYRTAGAILHALSHTSVDPDILSALGRIFMQAGNVSIAQTIFKRVNEVLGSADASVRPDLVLSNSACIFMCDGDWERAAAYLTQLLTLNPSSAVCVNNLALCQLYSGNVSQAVSFLDSSIIDVPKKAGVAEQILFNLCSLYDLMDVSHERKKLLVTNVLSRFVGDDFDPSCLKL
ncbi:hypothetical protein BC832DRAFT_535314 [Gaertneriomyces semiglobifer]|nr:hypothetical protein BC832DRAFT_535314 [Gaertneriomyces semiglobifer]